MRAVVVGRGSGSLRGFARCRPPQAVANALPSFVVPRVWWMGRHLQTTSGSGYAKLPARDPRAVSACC